jgi:hypothetical protein
VNGWDFCAAPQITVRHQPIHSTRHRYTEGGNVTKRLTRIGPWQAGKLFAVVYFLASLVFVIPLELVALLVPAPAGSKAHLSPAFILMFPFMYALAALLFVPLGCWIYNIAAKWVGGLELTLADDADA